MRAYPEKDVEYTFIFNSGKKYTFVFMEEDANGRLVFFNKTTESMTSFHKDRFSYLGRFNLISRRKIPPVAPMIKEVPPEMIEQVEMTKEEQNEVLDKMMQNLKKIGSAEAMQCYEALKNNCEGLSQDELNNVFTTYERLVSQDKGENLCKLV